MATAVVRHCTHLYSSPLFLSLTQTAARRRPQLRSTLRSLFLKSKSTATRTNYFASSSSSFSSSTNSNKPDGNADSNGGSPSASPESQLYLLNTMSRAKELFRPRVAGTVGMYVCGVTSYDFSHIGHARVYVTFDVLYRYLQHLKYEVFYVRNFTDVDDKDT